MSCRVHSLVQDADDVDAVVLHDVEDEMAADRVPPIAVADLVTGAATVWVLADSLDRRPDRVEVGLALKASKSNGSASPLPSPATSAARRADICDSWSSSRRRCTYLIPATDRLPGRRLPWIDQRNSGWFEVARVAGGQCGLPSRAHCRDLRVCDSDGVAACLTVGDDLGVAVRCPDIERQDHVVKVGEHVGRWCAGGQRWRPRRDRRIRCDLRRASVSTFVRSAGTRPKTPPTRSMLTDRTCSA